MKRKTVETKNGTNMSPCLCLIYIYTWVYLSSLPLPLPDFHLCLSLLQTGCLLHGGEDGHPTPRIHNFPPRHPKQRKLPPLRNRGPVPKKDFDWPHLGPITFAEGLGSCN